MNNPNLNQAREWAKELEESNFTPSERLSAAMQVIQSLPDHWFDAEEVRELVVKYEAFAEDAEPEGEKGRIRAALYRNFVGVLEALLPAPPLPTLADMTQEEREACQWMQADVKLDISGATVRRVIAHPGSADMNVSVWAQYGGGNFVDAESVTPLPDLPKLQWPGGVVDAENVDEPEDTCSGSIHTPMQPSEVPPNEPWLIEVDGRGAVGARYAGDSILSWSVAALAGAFAGDYGDSEVTLIHKLVAEPPALPEGMRLADHEWEGRVVVSPKVDNDGDYVFFHSNSGGETGAGWGYTRKSELTFLDDEQ